MPKNAHSQSYRKRSELSSPLITLAVLGQGNPSVSTVVASTKKEDCMLAGFTFSSLY
jgi:hypothetical protein